MATSEDKKILKVDDPTSGWLKFESLINSLHDSIQTAQNNFGTEGNKYDLVIKNIKFDIPVEMVNREKDVFVRLPKSATNAGEKVEITGFTKISFELTTLPKNLRE